MRHITLLSRLWLLAIAAAGCGESVPRLQSTPAQNLSAALPTQYFEIIDTITLEENDDVINVSVHATPQPDGSGFLVVDQREARTRIYTNEGKLLRQFGRRGQGPGEFQRPISGYQLPSGRIVVADLGNGLLRFASPDSLISATRPPVRMLYGVIPVSDSIALVAGGSIAPVESDRVPLLHLWNLNTGEPQISFFPTPGDSLQRVINRNFGWVGTALRGDTVVAVSALTDTLYLFDLTGRHLRSIHLPIRGFSPMRERPERAVSDPVQFNRWLEQFHFLNSVFPLPDGSFLVQYEQQSGAGSRWNLLHMEPSGTVRFDLKDTPRLLTTQGVQLFFQDPAAEVPNRWLVTRLRDVR